MKTLEDIDKRELRELLHKCWLTHEAMWFYNCAVNFGMEKTNEINKAAVKSMAMIEAKRVAKLMGVGEVGTFEDFKKFMAAVIEIVKADFMDFSITFPEENVLHWEMRTCFAYDGVKRIGFIEEYRCGIFERMKGWLESLGIKYTVTPEVDGCMMLTDGKCYRDFHLKF